LSTGKRAFLMRRSMLRFAEAATARDCVLRLDASPQYGDHH